MRAIKHVSNAFLVARAINRIEVHDEVAPSPTPASARSPSQLVRPLRAKKPPMETLAETFCDIAGRSAPTADECRQGPELLFADICGFAGPAPPSCYKSGKPPRTPQTLGTVPAEGSPLKAAS